MTIIEKAAYLKGLVEGLGVEPDSRDGKLWSALTDLLGEIAREIDQLHTVDDDLSQVLDEVCEEIAYVEEIVGDPDDDSFDPDFWGDEDDEDGDGDVLTLSDADADDDEDEEPEFDGVVYDVTCPNCGEEISFDEETLEAGSIKCPGCGEILQFDLGEDS